MRHRIPALALILLVVAILGVAAQPAVSANIYIRQMAQPEEAKRHETLLAHGVNPRPAALINFIENGFSDQAIGNGLPDAPQPKTQVVLYAIQELGFQEATQAVPLLSNLAKGELPVGARSILQRDTEKLPIHTADERRRALAQYIKLNAIVALGYVGDPSALEVIRDAIPVVPAANALTVEGALARGELGDGAGIDDLAAVIAKASDSEKAALYEAIFVLTGRNYGVTENTSNAKLQQIDSEFLDWFRREGRDFKAIPQDILRRRAEGLEVPDPPVSTLRGALRASRQFDDYDRRYAARELLQKIAPSSAGELRTIVKDIYEDNDIRLAAMDWYAAVQPKEARSLMKQMAREEQHPLLRRRAEILIKEIEELLNKD